MINVIGAYVVTVCLLAIYQKRPSLAAGEARLSKLPVWAHLILLAYLGAIALCVGERRLQEFLFISLPSEIIMAVSFWIHEAGHIYFLWGGTFLHHLGGTLTELLFPIIPACFCLKRGYKKLGALFLYWAGLVCFDIGPYLADARARVLPLSTGDSAGHDWHNMLEILGMLEWDTTLAHIVMLTGWTTITAAFALYLLTLRQRSLEVPPSLQ